VTPSSGLIEFMVTQAFEEQFMAIILEVLEVY
jgi:hypothetical protein